MAAQDLVHQPHLALDQKLNERDLPVIKMREIDAGIEHAAAGVFRVLHHAAAHHAHLDGIVEQDEIDGDFRGDRGDIAFGVEEFRIGHGDAADLAFALDLRLAEIGKAGAAEFAEAVQRLALGLEHGVDQMHAAALVSEDMSEEQALIDLVALLGALLHQRALFPEPLGRRQQRRIAGGRRHHQLGNA